MVTRSLSVAVIILNWNNWPDTLACVASCQRLARPGARIVVVDNGSTDGSEEMLRERLPGVEIVQTGANLGFAGGNNVGIRHAVAQGVAYVWLLNNDAVADPAALTALIEAMEADPAAAAAGSKVYYHDDPQRIWSVGGIWGKRRLRLRQRGARQLDRGQFETPAAVGSVSGCSMLLRASAIAEIGLLDEGYFLYWEDTDWCARAGERGYRVLSVPASRVWHKVSASVAARSQVQYYYNTRNGLHFCARYDAASLVPFILYATADVVAGMLRGNRAMACGYLKGIADFLRGVRGHRPLP